MQSNKTKVYYMCVFRDSSDWDWIDKDYKPHYFMYESKNVVIKARDIEKRLIDVNVKSIGKRIYEAINS